MRPSEEFGKVIRVSRLCSRACGADVINPNYKINAVTYVVIFCITVYFVFSIYTVQHKISENWTVALEAFCMVGSVLQGISKLVSGIVGRGILRRLCTFLAATYADFESKGGDYVGALSKSTTRVRIGLKSVAWLYGAVVSWSIFTPLVVCLISGRRLFVMQFYIPFMDPNTVLGYLVTIGMQSTCISFGAFGNFAGDMFNLIYLEHSTLLADIFELKVKDLNRHLANFGSPQTDFELKEVIKWHQSYVRFIEESEAVFYWIIFTQVTTSGLSIVLTLVIMFTGDWPGSYAYIFLSFVMLFIYSGVGTIVEISNERIMDTIYDIEWYSMTAAQQRAVCFMIMRAQSMQSISVGGVAPLSVNTGLQVTKMVYSVFMMLLNFFD